MNAEIKPNWVKPRWNKVLSDLWNDKTRTSLVVASIAAGVFAVGMIISAYVIMTEDISRSYAAVNPPNIEMRTDPFDGDLVHVIEEVPGVRDVEGHLVLPVRARRGAEDWQTLTLVGVSDFNGNIDHLKALEGTKIAGKGEIIITEDMMHVSGFHPGDKIEVEFPDGSNHSLNVVGLIADQTVSKPDPSATNYAYVTLKTLHAFGVDDHFNQLDVTVAGDGYDREVIASVAAAVKDKVERSHRTVYRMDEHPSNEHPMTDITFAVIGVLGALGGLITLLGSSLIINTLNALLAQQLRQIGVMKLVGARSIQILGMYLTLVIAYGLIALIIAVPFGTVAGYGLAWFIAYLLGAAVQGFRVIPMAVVAQILIAIFIPVGAGFFPIHSGVRTSVQQAISNNRPGQAANKRGGNRWAKWINWISRPILLSFRNTFRKQGRLLLTIFTLTIAGAVFIAVFNVRDSLNSLAANLLQHFQGDVNVNFERPYRVSEIEHTLLQIPGVQGVEGWGGAAGEIWDGNDDLVSRVNIVAPPQDTKLLDLNLVAGRWLLPNEQKAIVISDSIYDFYPNLRPGDSLIIKLPGRQKESWKVVGIFPFVALLGDPMAYANFEFIAERNHLPGDSTSYRIIINDHNIASQETLTRHIDAYLTEGNFAVKSVEAGYILREKAKTVINILVSFLLIMAILTAFVGSIGLTGAMSINVLERTREIGVMRTIGAVDGVIMQSVIIEGLVIGLITWVLAMGLSFPISKFLLAIIGSSIMSSTMELNFTPLGILIWLGVVIALSIFASIMPARNAARLTINEVLAYE